MNQIEKFVRKLDKKLAQKIAIVLQNIAILNLGSYKIKKLEGYDGLYRIRIGKIRIIFRKLNNAGEPIYIEYRGQVYQKQHQS